MADDDLRGGAWRVAPSAYLQNRPAAYAIAGPRSLYVPAPDGCRLAIDVYLPDRAAPEKRWPTICLFTPYYRRFRLKAGTRGVEPAPNTFRFRDFFVPRGYAIVVVDVRGTGASFDSFRSPRERGDFSVIADWIVAQPWSDGKVGATGVSYLGAASDFLASTGHPAVKAIAPLFSVWDTYSDHYYPGGILLNQLARVYDDLMVGLDHDRRELLGQSAYYDNPAYEGPQPVDDDADGVLCRAAVREHLDNFRMPDFITEFKFKDDALPYDPGFSSADFSPYHYATGIAAGVAVYSVSGWMDGAGFSNSAIARYLTLANGPRHLLLGPWDHGARVNVSPWRDRIEPRFDVLAEVLRFFDEYLAGTATGLRDEAPIHYFTIHAERWREATSWPPVATGTRLHLDAQGALSSAKPAVGVDMHAVDFSRGTGNHTRYERLAAVNNTDYYGNVERLGEGMLCYTSEPLPHAMELSGHAVANLHVAASEPDAALFVYLLEIELDGTVRYVTEGMLRALHRKLSPCPPNHRATWPWRSFARADAKPLSPGAPELMTFALLPTSWMFHAGSRIRLAISGADADHCVQVPHGRPPRLTICRGGEKGSFIDLPLAQSA